MKKYAKRFGALLCALLIMIPLMTAPAAAAEQTYTQLTAGDRFTVDTVEQNGSWYPWSLSEDGVLQSGNRYQDNSYAVLRVQVRGNGVLCFLYKVSAPGMKDKSTLPNVEYVPDSLFYWQDYGGAPATILTKSPSTITGMYDATRVYGETDWTMGTIKVEGKSGAEITDVYFAYKKNGSVDGAQDCVWLKDLAFTDGMVQVAPVANDPERGSVSAPQTIQVGEMVTVTATPAGGCRFYGWNHGGNLVSTETSYTFMVGANNAPVAIFGKDGVTAAQDADTGYVYDTVQAALDSAKAGGTVMPLEGAVIETDTTIPAGVTLYVPFDETANARGFQDGTTANSARLATDAMAFRTLTVAEGAVLTVKGTLRLGGVIGYPGQFYQGHTSGAFGRIINNGAITVAAGGVLDCFGRIDGAGAVTAQDDATVYEPFIVYDFSGGTNTLGLVNAGQSPFAQYTMQNIRCDLRMQAGALLMGRCNLYASSQFNKVDAVIIGDGATVGIVTLPVGAELVRSVDLDKTCGDYCSDLGRVTYAISGGADFNDLAMTIMGVDVSTADAAFFPLPYGYRYELKDGAYRINNKMGIMPGASVTVHTGAELTVGNALYVLDGLKQRAMSGKSYPSTELLQKAGLNTNGQLIVNGELTVASGAKLGGIVQTMASGAVVRTKSGADGFTHTLTVGGKTDNGDNTTILPLNGRIRIDGELVKLLPGKIYTSLSGEGWTLEGYQANSKGEMETILTNQSMNGTFSLSECVSHTLTATAAKAATCTEDGNDAYWTCEGCGKYFSDAAGKNEITENSWLLPAAGHALTAMAAKTPTCTGDGSSAYWTCGKCGKYFSDAAGEKEIAADSWILPAAGHDLTATAAKAATCTEDGSSAYWTCGKCGKYFSDAAGKNEIAADSWILPATGHELTAVAAKEPTCTEDGSRACWTCGKCHRSFSDIAGKTELTEAQLRVGALGHDPVTDAAKAPTCTAPGLTEGSHCGRCGVTLTAQEPVEPLDHDYGDWTSVDNTRHQRVCRRDSSHVETTGHDYTDTVTAPTCTEQGYTIHACTDCGYAYMDTRVSALGHSFTDYVRSEDGTTETAKCDRCDATDKRAVAEEHNYTDTVTAPTCTEQGYTTHTCNDCGHSYTDSYVPALGHSFTTYTANGDATCTQDGTKTAKCGRCDATDTKPDTGSRLGHELTATAAKEPTCTEDGNSAYWTCGRCGGYFSDAAGETAVEKDSWILTRLSHRLTETAAKAATFARKGNSAYWTCETCGKYFSNAGGTTEIEYGSWILYRLGDTNKDGKVNAIDAAYLARYLANMVTFDAASLRAADVNGDTTVNKQDLLSLMEYLAYIK